MQRRTMLFLVVLLATAGGCRRRLPEGSCRVDIDCQAGFDCKLGVCIRRPKPAWEVAAAPSPRPAPVAATPRPGTPWQPMPGAPAGSSKPPAPGVPGARPAATPHPGVWIPQPPRPRRNVPLFRGPPRPVRNDM